MAAHRLAHEVQRRRERERIGGVAMHAAQETPYEVGILGERPPRPVRARHARVEHRIEVHAAREARHEEEEGERSEVTPRIGVRRKDPVERHADRFIPGFCARAHVQARNHG
jgi:hypothetical protein